MQQLSAALSITRFCVSLLLQFPPTSAVWTQSDHPFPSSTSQTTTSSRPQHRSTSVENPRRKPPPTLQVWIPYFGFVFITHTHTDACLHNNMRVSQYLHSEISLTGLIRLRQAAPEDVFIQPKWLLIGLGNYRSSSLHIL